MPVDFPVTQMIAPAADGRRQVDFAVAAVAAGRAVGRPAGPQGPRRRSSRWCRSTRWHPVHRAGPGAPGAPGEPGGPAGPAGPAGPPPPGTSLGAMPLSTRKMSVWSIVPWMLAACGPVAQTGTCGARVRLRAAGGGAGAGVGRPVGDADRRAVDRLERRVRRARSPAWSSRMMICDVCAWSAVTITSVSGWLGLVVERDADGLVERQHLADLPADVGGVVALVDRGALDLQREARPGRPRAARSPWPSSPAATARCRGSAAGSASSRDRRWTCVVDPGCVVGVGAREQRRVLRRHVARVEEAEHLLAAREVADGGQLLLGGDVRRSPCSPRSR